MCLRKASQPIFYLKSFKVLITYDENNDDSLDIGYYVPVLLVKVDEHCCLAVIVFHQLICPGC